VENEKMYGYFSGSNNELKDEIVLEEYEEFEQLISKYPEHEIYLFLGTDIDMALFCAPGILAMLIEKRASPDKIF
jgi:hypothetical protein